MRYRTGWTGQVSLSAPSGARRSLLSVLPSPVGLIPSPIMWALLQATVVVAMLLAVSGAGSPAMILSGRGDSETVSAVELLITGQGSGPDRRTELVASIPEDYVSVMGYRPEVIEINNALSLAKPIGTCSSPVHLVFDMEPTCKGHDLGYDLLRYAAAIGAPLGVWARPLIDDWWFANMHQRCESVHSGLTVLACHGQVLATEAVINVNTWREGYGPPIEENPWRYLGAAVLLPLTLLAVVRFRRTDSPPVGRLQSGPEVSGFRA